MTIPYRKKIYSNNAVNPCDIYNSKEIVKFKYQS